MATEQTPPRNTVIAVYTAASVAVLLGLHFAFVSYFNHVKEAELDAKVRARPAAALEAYRAEQRAALEGGAVPVDRAIEQLGRAGRLGSPSIAPAGSTAVDALTGWNERPNAGAAEAARAAMAAAEAARAATLLADGGTSPEGGAPPAE